MLWYPLNCVELVIHHVWKIRRYFTKPYTYASSCGLQKILLIDILLSSDSVLVFRFVFFQYNFMSCRHSTSYEDSCVHIDVAPCFFL
ncbi:unnamed protein product [Brassica oleracea]